MCMRRPEALQNNFVLHFAVEGNYQPVVGRAHKGYREKP